MDEGPHIRRVARRGALKPADLAERDAHVEAVARELFTTIGYARTTIEEVSRRASVAKRTLYKVYGGKAGMFAMVVRGTPIRAAVASRLEGLDSAEAVLKAVACSFLIGPAAQRGVDLMRLIIAEADSQPELAREAHASGRIGTIKAVTRVFERLFERGLLPRQDVAPAAELFVDSVIGSMMLIRLCNYERDLETRIDAAVARFVRTLNCP